MRLIYTTTLITLAVMVTFSLATSLFSTRHIQRSYESLEDNIALNNLGRVNYAIADRLAALEKTAADWGIWDDTYNFIQTGDQSYIDLNLSQEYFTRMNLGLIAFFDTSNQMVFYLSLDTETEQMMELRSEDLSELQRFIPVSLESHKIKNSGIISLYDRLMLVTSHPILRSDNRGPASGTILKGTWLDERLVNEIAHSTRLNFTILPFSPTELRGLSGESLHPLVSGGQTLIVKPDIRTLNAYELVNDYKNNPVLINQISEPRDAYAQGRQVIAWWNTVLLALAIIFVGMLIILIYLLIIRRLQRLTSGLQKISESQDLSLRMPVEGRDEIALLSTQTNDTLQQIEVFHQQLKSSEEKFRKISELAQDVIYQISLSPAIGIEYISPSVEKVLGYTVDEVMHRPSWLFDTVHPDDRTKLDAYLNRPPGVSEKSIILSWRHKNGSTIWIEHANSVIKNADGKQTRIIGAGRNITERIQLESHMVELYQKEKEIRQELEKEANARAYFVNVLGHELKTPLTPLMISLDMLKDLNEPDLPPLQAKLINNAAESVKILGNRLDELLDLARFARGTFRLDKTVLDIREYLEKAVERFKPALESRKQKLSVRLSDSLGQVSVDPYRMEQVISNLMSNAGKYSNEGQEIEFRAGRENGHLVVEVEDHGIGISVEEQQRLFEPYHRVEQDRQRFAGLGLGLAVARQIVEAHGGSLTVTSVLNKGSIFKFTIPVGLN